MYRQLHTIMAVAHGTRPRKIMENNYPELWNRSKSIVQELVKVQNRVVEMLPAYNENLPKSFEELAEEKAQRHLLGFIRLRLLYEFVGMLWESIDHQCFVLSKERNIDEKDALSHLLDATSSFPFEEIVKDNVAGILRFNENYAHKCFGQWLGNTCFESWRCDVMGGIRDHGLQCDWLWRDAIDYKIPTCSNIGELLSDNEMLRV